jgi:hypothetical protein
MDLLIENVDGIDFILDKGVFKRGRCSKFWVAEVGYNSTCRCCNMVGDKHNELFKALEYFTNGSKFNHDNWEVLNPRNVNYVNQSINCHKTFEADGYIVSASLPSECIKGDSKDRCICTQTIHNLCYVRYIPNDELVLIGSDCIEKFLGVKAKLKAEGKLCIFCDEDKIDCRKSFGKLGFCSITCKNKSDQKNDMIERLQNSISSSKLSKEYEANLIGPLCRLCNYFKVDSKKSYGKLGYCSKNCSMAEKNRLCGGCLDFTIPRTQEWKTECKDCYKK